MAQGMGIGGSETLATQHTQHTQSDEFKNSRWSDRVLMYAHCMV